MHKHVPASAECDIMIGGMHSDTLRSKDRRALSVFEGGNNMKKNLVKRYLILAAGLMIMAFGVAFSIKGDLGTSPISSLPYVTGQISGFTVGTTTIVLHCVLIALQILLLRRKYQMYQLLQLPVAFVFGWMTDFAMWAVQGLKSHSYAGQWMFCIIGILLVAVGVSFEITANVVTLAGEGMVLAVCRVWSVPFGKAKVSFDVTLVAVSVLLSFLFLHGLYGVREGTVAAAVCVGMISKRLNPHLKKAAAGFLGSPQISETRED